MEILGTKAAKNKSTALFLAIVLGGFGAHRFYTGHYLTGILFPFSLILGFYGIYLSDKGYDLIGNAISVICVVVQFWAIIDLFRIVSGSFLDSNGNPLVKKKNN
jgi:TM2 domain-containing membrane protein YozV